MASGNIKGITIELDGNTTKLQDALKKSEKSAKDAASSITQIEKALKFNPGNTELVAQQQRNLQKAIEATKEKLKILRDSDAQMKDQLNNKKITTEQYEAFQREIITTESKLGNLEKKYQGSVNEEEKLRDATSKLQLVFEKTGTNIDDFASLLGEDVVESFKKGEGSSKDMEEALNKLGEELLGTGGDADDLNQKLSQLDSGVSFDELKNSAQESGESLEEMGDSADSANEELEDINNTSISIQGLEAAVNLFEKLFDVAKKAFGAIRDAWSEVDEAQDTITAKTGATGEVAKGLQQSFDNVYSKLPVDAQKVGDAIGEVNTQFGLQGEALEEASSGLIKFTELNGTDVTQTTQQAKAAMDQFNLSGDRLTDVLDAVNQAGQDTGQSANVLFDKVTNGAPVLQSMNLSFEESVALVSQLEQGGYDSSKAIGYLTKAQAVGAKDGKSLNQTLKEFTSFANSSASETDKLNKASELFGAKGGAMMLKAAKEGKLNFDSLKEAASGAAGSVAETYENTLDPADQFIVAQNNLKIALNDMGSTIQEIFAPAINFLVDLIQKATKAFKGLPDGVKQTIVVVAGIVAAFAGVVTGLAILKAGITAAGPMIAGLGSIFTGVGSALGGLVSFVAANPIVLIIAAIVAGVVLLIKHWDTVKKTTKDLWDNIKQAFEGIKTAISGAWDAVKAKTSEIWNGIKTEISNIWEGIKTGIGNAVEAVKTKVSGVWDEVKTKTLEIWNGIKTGISNIWEGIKTGVGGAVGAVKDKVTNIFSGLKDTVSKIWEGIKDAITKPIDKAKEIVGKIIEKIKGFFNFKIEWPHIPVPHFTIQPPGWKFGDLLKGSIPTLGIDWRDQGGIFYNPAIIGVGEKRPEFVGALDDLKAIVADVIKKENKDISGEAPVVIHIDSMVVRDDQDISKIANELAKYLKKEKRVRHA